jgi:SAM-dependent methyltransferase
MSAPQSNNYWEREGATKTFTHPVNLEWLARYLGPECRILDYGCGYGRVMALLFERGYRQLLGVDASGAMIEKARALYPHLSFVRIDPPNVPLPDASLDAAILFAVLTCIPGDEDQKALVKELYRVVRPRGFLYISDYWIQTDDRNRQRYACYTEQHRAYGVFDFAEGGAVRHHSRQWIESLLARWGQIAITDIKVTTMNGHEAAGFQWLGRRPAG